MPLFTGMRERSIGVFMTWHEGEVWLVAAEKIGVTGRAPPQKKPIFLMQEVNLHFLFDAGHQHAIWQEGEV